MKRQKTLNAKLILCWVALLGFVMYNFSFVEIKSSADTQINLALNKVVIPDREKETQEHLKLTDGIINVSSQSDCWVVRANSYMSIDLGESQDFSQIKVYEFNQNNVQRLRGYIIECSQNGRYWTVVKEVNNDILVCPDKAQSNNHFIGAIDFDKVKAQYLRLTIKNPMQIDDPTKKIAYIEELEVYNAAPESQQARVISSIPQINVEEIVANNTSFYDAIDYSSIIENESNWISQLQISNPGGSTNGGIPWTKYNPSIDQATGKKVYKIEPYFTSLASIGMLNNPSPENIEVF